MAENHLSCIDLQNTSLHIVEEIWLAQTLQFNNYLYIQIYLRNIIVLRD